jgi:hypothetical protein
MLATASALPADPVYWWAGIALLMVPLAMRSDAAPSVSALSVSVGLFCVWLIGNALFFTPHYSPHGLYRPITLLVAFWVAGSLNPKALEELFRAGVVVIVMLVLFGLAQVLFGFWPYENPARAAAAFATPNTFATVINLVLLPLVALVVIDRGGKAAYWSALLLFAGLLSTESRGGWLAFAAGVGTIIACAAWRDIRGAAALWRRLGVGLAAAAGAYYSARAASFWMVIENAASGTSTGGMFADMAARGSSLRTDLAAFALEQVSRRPLSGYGANTYWLLYEKAKPVELDLGMTYPFAHNDYLQTWLEFGLPGILMLILVVVAVIAVVARKCRAMGYDNTPLLAGAALAGTLTHAVVDFPTYIPLPILIFALWLGTLSRYAQPLAPLAQAMSRFDHAWRKLSTPITRAFVAIAATAWLAQPAMAEEAAKLALDALFSGNAEKGLYWQTVARRLEPQSGKRYWEEGVILRNLAVESGDRDYAAKADATFAAGMLADPYDVNNFAERARLHRLHPGLLDQPAAPAAVLAWAAHVLEMRPYAVATQLEYIQTLKFAGRIDEARRMADAVMARHPESAAARRLAAEL